MTQALDLADTKDAVRAPSFAHFAKASLVFSTAFHRKKPESCDEQPLLSQAERFHHGVVRVVLPKSAVTSVFGVRGRIPASKSLFRNILRTTPRESIFCPRASISR